MDELNLKALDIYDGLPRRVLELERLAAELAARIAALEAALENYRDRPPSVSKG